MRHYITVDNKKFLLTSGVLFHVKSGKKFFGIEVYMVHISNGMTYVKYQNRGIDSTMMQMPIGPFEMMIGNYFSTAIRRGTYRPKYVSSTLREGFLENFAKREAQGNKALRTMKHYRFRPVELRKFSVTDNKEYLCQ